MYIFIHMYFFFSLFFVCFGLTGAKCVKREFFMVISIFEGIVYV